MNTKNLRKGTVAVHAGVEPDPTTGAIMTPIYQTSTFAQEAPGVHKGYEYARTQNPTRHALEKSIAALENAQFGYCFASGMAATDTLMKLLKPGDEVLVTNDLYGGTYRIFTKVFAEYGIKFKFISMASAEDVQSHFTSSVKMVWIETPTNPLMNIIDIAEISKMAKANGALAVVDNTFATPILQNPLDLGADIVVHSVTKYIGGHSDTVLGAVATNKEDIAEKLAFLQNSCGAIPGPQDCFLVLRGIKTLQLRMQRHCENGEKIAAFLSNDFRVGEVYWPGLDSHKNHAIAKKQMHGFGGMISFTPKEDKIDKAIQILKNFKLFTLAESLGGVESLCGLPSMMTHASIPKEEREKAGLKDSLIRLSVGIEDAEDLLEDLDQALI